METHVIPCSRVNHHLYHFPLWKWHFGSLWNTQGSDIYNIYVWMFLMFSRATRFWSIAIAADCSPLRWTQVYLRPLCQSTDQQRKFVSLSTASAHRYLVMECLDIYPQCEGKLCDKGIDDLISWKICFSEILAEKRRGQPCNSNWLQLIVLFFVWYVEANNQIKYWCAYIYCIYVCIYIYILDYFGTKTSWFAKVTVTWLMTSPS